MVEGGGRDDDRLLAGPLGGVADLCGGLGRPQSHRVAAGSTPSPTEHHTKGPLFLALSIYPWPAGLHRPLPTPLAAHPGLSLLKPTQRLECPCRASLASEDPVHRATESSKGSWGGFVVGGKATSRPRWGGGWEGMKKTLEWMNLPMNLAPAPPPPNLCKLRSVWTLVSSSVQWRQ